MAKPSVDYSLYLVTDSTPAILGDKDLCQVVEASLQGGVTCVQYRDKHSPRDVVVDTAKKLHDVTKRYGVPLLINDHVDVAVEVECEGVHIGQDDMEFQRAKKLLGDNKIIGVTASTVDEAKKAAAAGADYLGIGTVYATSTKKDTKSIIGPGGVSSILSALVSAGHGSIQTVCIGGVNTSNARQVMSQSVSPRKALDGIAIVSAIVAAEDPAAAARDLAGQVISAKVPDVVRAVADKTPLSHNMTNLVVQNFAANVGLAVGASPIMANYAEEAPDLAKLGGALVINMGTVTPDGLKNYARALKAYNEAGRPVLLDPVGYVLSASAPHNRKAHHITRVGVADKLAFLRAGATAVRRGAVKTLLSSGHFTVIKGNEGELLTLHGVSVTQRGVDSSSDLNLAQKAQLARDLARAHTPCVTLLTGVTDILSDGKRTIRVDNGHELLGMVTGTGCTLGTTVSAMIAAYPADTLVAAVAGTAMFGVAAEMAAVRADVRGPGTFVPAFIDELYAIRKATSDGDMRWLTMVKIRVIDVPEA
ncbi:thiamine-phosphate diphosphorylase / hydroxyethylthiazole kinase [Geosmithia morbida]|uniref:Thiamine-phosphate diphosphorylase / hydroxyethylthiazole kinase n=1 Tax=Geosmithia morbida TaxID=1094350 RepID=A0A9P4YUG9_9HYPO|nr:thiamine-phosphate diphosphorylase / hydroxyethylthiazole kinase [Geosmithia morbida]KAF4121244.1 thiamine-phosphate diphosphorylase / hydroxyethylthiazole kinase [Geosmithia morbida]